MKYKHLIIVLIITLLPVACWHMSKNVQGAERPKSSYSIPRKVQMSFTLKNTTGKVIKDVEFRTYAPVEQTATQKVININSTHQYKMQTDGMGNRIMFFNIPVMPPYAVKIVDIEVELMLSESPKKIPIIDLSKYLKAEKYCESDHPAIKSLAKNQKGTNLEESARNIYQWVSRNIVYTGYTKNVRGALYALESRKGDCTEYAWLFTAFCRARDIAARTVGGFVCDTDCILKPGKYHNWAEFYDHGSWKLSDPQEKVFENKQSKYIMFKILGESNFEKSGNENGFFRCLNESVEVKMNS